LFDQESIRDATVDLKKIIDERKRELAELEQKYEQLRSWAGFTTAKPKKLSDVVVNHTSSTEDEVIRILNETLRPMNTMQVIVHMGTDANRKTVNWALWNAARENRIQKIEGRRGFYASLAYEPSENGDGARAEAEHPLSGDSASEARSDR
jgi:ribosomal protein L16 Arg81 hydroxylase